MITSAKNPRGMKQKEIRTEGRRMIGLGNDIIRTAPYGEWTLEEMTIDLNRITARVIALGNELERRIGRTW